MPRLQRLGSLAPFCIPSPRGGSGGSGGTGSNDGGMQLSALLAVGAASTLLSIIGTASVFVAWVQRMAPPRLVYKPTAANRALIMEMPLLFRSYVPNLLSWNAHAAGFFGYVKLPGRRPHSTEQVTMPDGGTVCLSWSSPPSDGHAIILLLPGINNDASMPYVRHLMSHLEDEGLGHVCALDWRGLGQAGKLTSASGTPRPYCAACAADVGDVITHLSVRYPRSALYAVGFSLGAGMLLQHLGETGAACRLTAAMAVSPSVHMASNYAHMARGTSRAYLPVIMAPLFAYLFHHRAELATGPEPISFWRDVLPAATHRFGLDALFARAWGLESLEAYHQRGSCVHVLHNIQTRTLIVHASDDPVCPVSALPLDQLARNPHLITAITRHGGHMGFTAGLMPLGNTWTDRLLVHYLRALSGAEELSGEGVATPMAPAVDAPSVRIHSKL